MKSSLLIDNLLNFLSMESEAQREEHERIRRKSLKDKVLMGEAIADVKPLGTVAHRELRLRRFKANVNLSKFRAGDYLILQNTNAKDIICYCQLYEDNGSELVLQENTYKHPESMLMHFNAQQSFTIERDLPDVNWILEKAIGSLEFHSRGNEILDIVLGKVKPQFSDKKLAESQEVAASIPFNNTQARAFVHAVSTKNFYTIQGPPGTGKTFLLAHIAAYLAGKGEKVLITSLTHRAINNALVKIAKDLEYPYLLKVGDPLKSYGLQWEGGEVTNAPKLEYIQLDGERLSKSHYNHKGGGLILGGSIFHLHTRRLNDIEFDTVIFDEAGQVNLPQGIAGMMASKKHIFVGDHKQMSPITAASHSDASITKSIFEAVFEHGSGTMLDTTFRMNAQIAAFPSQQFYGGALKPISSNKNRQIAFDKPPQRHQEALNPAYSTVFVDVAHTDHDMRSPAEADYIASVVEELLNCGIPAEEIAIIAPYRAQGRLIRKTLHEQLSTAGHNPKSIITDTVERMQGQEREVIIISLTTSDPEHALQKAQFYFQPNRLNVAITRAKTKLIVVGSRHLFEIEIQEPKLREWFNIFKSFYEHAHKVRVAE